MFTTDMFITTIIISVYTGEQFSMMVAMPTLRRSHCEGKWKLGKMPKFSQHLCSTDLNSP